MDDLIYRNNAIAEENIDPHGRPAKDEFEEFSEEVSEHTDLGYKEQKVKSAKERKKRLKEMYEIVKEEIKYLRDTSYEIQVAAQLYRMALVARNW